jgi:ribosomal protein S18 acetylase RimI-like enzyme
MGDLRWTTPTRADDADWADLLGAMEAVDEHGETYGPEDLDDEWESVWSHPETDATFVWDGPTLVAFAWLKIQPGQRAAHRIACWGGVRPSHRGQGIGRAVLEWSVARATEAAAGLEDDLGVNLLLDAGDHQADLLAVAARVGFEPVRRFLELGRPVAAPRARVGAPAGLVLQPWCEELDEATRQAHVESFADHWGAEPRSREEWRQWYTGHRGFRPDLSVVAVDEASGEVAGYVLCAAYPQDWATLPPEAWINSVGTRRAWRGKGVARWLLTDSLDRMARSDTAFVRAMLGVDADNPTGALGLYRSLAFDQVRATTTLGRTLR